MDALYETGLGGMRKVENVRLFGAKIFFLNAYFYNLP